MLSPAACFPPPQARLHGRGAASQAFAQFRSCTLSQSGKCSGPGGHHESTATVPATRTHVCSESH